MHEFGKSQQISEEALQRDKAEKLNEMKAPLTRRGVDADIKNEMCEYTERDVHDVKGRNHFWLQFRLKFRQSLTAAGSHCQRF